MPQHKRGPWSTQEDQLLLTLVNLHGAHNWVRISSTIGTRSPKQCRERFHQNLKPNLNHEPITPEEGLLIERMVAEMGKRWAEIARQLRGRSDNAVKNWWNGSMNRRRRSHHQRRQELGVRRQSHGMHAPAQQPLPPTFPQHQQHYQQQQQQQQHHHHHHHHHAPQVMQAQQIRPQFYGQTMYQPARTSFPPQPISLPSNAPPLRQLGLIETPLPSPSTLSQLSGEGAPSLVSDCSSTSGRSPYNGGSPIELPPLSGTRYERRNSAAPILHLGAPASFASDPDYPIPTMQITRADDAHKQSPHVLQEHFPPALVQRGQGYHHSVLPRQSSSLQPVPMPQHFSSTQYIPPPPTHVLKSQQSRPVSPAASVQLPSISDLAAPGRDSRPRSSGLPLDPVPSQPHGTPKSNAFATVEGSPKDKMSLSNITS